MHSASKLGTLNKLIYHKNREIQKSLQLFSTIVMQNDFVSILR